MPAKYKPSECPHEILLGKTISINPQERTSAKAKGYTVPDQVRMNWCIGCWSINPPQIVHDSTTEDPHFKRVVK